MDKYTKLQKIGQGSFGSAYLCVKKHEPHGRKFVLKEIRMDPRDQGTALREAKLLAALDHPNIIACRESFLAGPHVLCIVTEFADGGDLRKQLTDRAARRAPLPETELLDLFLQCCLALKHLHDRKIIHRDIKPENIFLTSSQVVKLGDFGVATVLSHTLACAQTLTGTPYYTSPEICLGKKYTNKTDVWSLGCVLYELATFAHAFNGRSQRQLFETIVHGSFTPVARVAPQYSARLGALVTEMLQKNPRDRPSVNQLIRRPVLMERAHQFLSQRAVADALAHTVLHGQHIFQPPKPVGRLSPPPKPVPAVAATPARRGVPAAGPRRNSLKSSGSKRNVVRKLVSPKKSARAAVAAGVPPPPPPVAAPKAANASPALRKIEQRLQQRKHEAQRAGKPLAGGARTPVPVAKQPGKPQAAASPTPSSVSDRVSAFNAQWQAQRKQILRNLASPPSPALPVPPPSAVAPVARAAAKTPLEPAAAAPPPPAPLLATGVVVQRGKKPSSAAALAAAKQREAMRRDILERKKQQLAKRGSLAPTSAAASPSPLDDPVILVQNLPDYTKPTPTPKAVILPPPPPVTTAKDVGKKEVEEEEEEDDDDSVPTPDSTVAERANLEFQRMLLQLQSVVDEPEQVDDDDNDDDDDDDGGGGGEGGDAAGLVAQQTPVAPLDSTSGSSKDQELRGTTTLPPPPYEAPPLVDKPLGGVVVSTTLLDDPGFKAALRAKLRGSSSDKVELEGPEARALEWMYQYIREVL